MNIITSPIYACKAPSIGGIREVWFQSRNGIALDWVRAQTSPFQYGSIDTTNANDAIPYTTSAQQGAANFYPLVVRTDGTLTQTMETSPSRSYLYALSLTVSTMDFVRRDALERLSVAKKPVFLIKDYNERWWMIGESYGCTVTINGQTDVHKGNNIFSISATCRERYPMRELSCDFVETFVSCEAFDCLALSAQQFAVLETYTFGQLYGIPFN